MRRLRAIIVVAALLAAGLSSTVFLTRATSASTGGESRSAVKARTFVGYWMGIDPLDGGDSRRGITPKDDGTFSIIGRDTVFTLCDGTDRGSSRSTTPQSSTPHWSATTLSHVHQHRGHNEPEGPLDPIDRNILRETTTTTSGDPVDESSSTA